MVDKYAVREFVADVIGKEHLIPLIGVWSRPEDIDFAALPDQFVLKCNHNSGDGMYICKDKRRLKKTDVRRIKMRLKKALKVNYYYLGREYAYKNVDRKIVCEQYMTDESGYELKDYKIFTFGGKAYCIEVDYDRFTDHHRNFYSTSWGYLPFTTQYPTNPEHVIKRPECLEEMIVLAEKLAKAAGSPAFLRVDFYVVEGKTYFGELTFHHDGGCGKFMPKEWDERLGELIVLQVGM